MGDLSLEALTLSSLLRQHPDHVAAEMDDEVVMMNVHTGSYWSLNEAATFIWNRLATTSSIGTICDAMMAEFDVSRSTCEADVMRFVTVMLSDGLLQRVDSQATECPEL